MSPVLDWFSHESAGAPPALGGRAGQYLDETAGSADIAQDLASAALRALRATLAHPGGRDVALDLLAADALVTLALKARAESDPRTLGDFAARLRAAGAEVR